MELLLTTDPLLSSMEHVFNRSLDRAFKSLTPASDHSAVVLSCPFDITETPKAFQLVADAPGMTGDDVKVELHDNVLVVSGEKSIKKEHVSKNKDGEVKVWRQERKKRKFSRSFQLPENAKADGITAKMEHGVLTVEIPKQDPPEKPKPKRIRVDTAGHHK